MGYTCLKALVIFNSNQIIVSFTLTISKSVELDGLKGSFAKLGLGVGFEGFAKYRAFANTFQISNICD